MSRLLVAAVVVAGTLDLAAAAVRLVLMALQHVQLQHVLDS